MTSLHEQLSRRFFQWELRGRGWQVYPYQVRPEPPFRPFIGYSLPQMHSIDDGRRPTRTSGFLERLSKALSPSEEAPEADEEEEPWPDPDERDAVIEVQLTLPKTRSGVSAAMESLLLALDFCREPLAFELVGTHQEIVVQFAVAAQDASHLKQQLRGFFPDVEIVLASGYLDSQWRSAGTELVCLELGLAEMFMVPLAQPRQDVFIGMIAAMADLAPGELAMFQVVFEGTHHAWSESILHSVTDASGKPFFVNRPELVARAKEKIRSPLFAAVVRIAVWADETSRAGEITRQMGTSMTTFGQADSNTWNGLSRDDYPLEVLQRDLLDRQSRRTGMLLNLTELTGLVHLPGNSVMSAKLRCDSGLTRAAPEALTRSHDLILGKNSYAGQEKLVSLSLDQRVRHMHILGGSGYGKTTFLFNCLRQDIENGHGCGLLDPHGDLADRLLDFIPRERLGDVVWVDPTDETVSVGFNILAAHSDFEKDLIASDLVAVFRRQSSSWGEQMESVLHHAILTFLESSQGGTLVDLKNFLLDAETRTTFLKTVSDPDLLFYWKKGFPQLGGTRSVGPVVTRLEKLLSRKPVKRMVSQRVNRLDFADILDSKKIFIAKLPQGQIGAENAFLLGSLLVSKFQQMAMARQRMREEERREFFLYIDEAANFLTPSMAEILSGARKYRLGLVLSHQSLSQLKTEPLVAGALDANACTRVVFRVGDQDARALAEGFAHFNAAHLQNLSVGEAICRVERSEVDFNLITFPENGRKDEIDYSERAEVVSLSHETYGRSREVVPTPITVAQVTIDDLPVTSPEEPVIVVPPQPIPPIEIESAPLPSSSTLAPASDPPVASPSPSPPAPKPYQPTEVRADVEAMGRGGELHRAAQHELKLVAESLGFRATIERQLPGTQETVDLYLQRDEEVIGCEISVTNTLEYELRNMSKLMRAGVPLMVMITLDAEKLSRLEPAIRHSFSESENMKIRCMVKADFISFLQSLVIQSPAPSSSKKQKGWKVTRTVIELSPEELKEREQQVASTMADSVRRRAKSRKS
jgi:hypothetical protein